MKISEYLQEAAAWPPPSWGTGVQAARRREAAMFGAIEAMAKKYRIGNWKYRHPLTINSRGDVYVGVSQQQGLSGNSLQIPDKLVRLALKYAKPTGPHSHASAQIIEMNHFAWEKFLSDIGLLKIPTQAA